MYNLLISSNREAWTGNSHVFERFRCLSTEEYTAQHLVDRFGSLNDESIAALRLLPCIFAYESWHEVDPLFGQLTDINVRQRDVRIEYRLQPIEPFLTMERMAELSGALDIGRMELNRTHWAVKNVNLPQELAQRGIAIPAWARERRPPININHHQFDVALSFPGQARQVVQPIADEIERLLGPNRCFYDHNYRGALARPNLDALLQDIYGNRSRLLVVFISGEYQERDWCGIEFRAIRQIINAREFGRVMFIKTGEGNVEGVMPADGYVDARRESVPDIAHFIQDRLAELELQP